MNLNKIILCSFVFLCDDLFSRGVMGWKYCFSCESPRIRHVLEFEYCTHLLRAVLGIEIFHQDISGMLTFVQCVLSLIYVCVRVLALLSP